MRSHHATVRFVDMYLSKRSALGATCMPCTEAHHSARTGRPTRGWPPCPACARSKASSCGLAHPTPPLPHRNSWKAPCKHGTHRSCCRPQCHRIHRCAGGWLCARSTVSASRTLCQKLLGSRDWTAAVLACRAQTRQAARSRSNSRCRHYTSLPHTQGRTSVLGTLLVLWNSFCTCHRRKKNTSGRGNQI